MIRLQKFLADCGVASRRKAEVLIEKGEVKVNGKVVTELGTKVDPKKDQVTVKNKPVRPSHHGVLLLNKPRGVICTLSDPQGRRTVSYYLSKNYESYFPVGRLDRDSIGLLILTNDGELAQRLLHPKYEFPRVYRVLVQGEVPEHVLTAIETGVRLDDGIAKAKVEYLGIDEEGTRLEITIKEGRNRIVRRMMEKLRHPVISLKRISHGPFHLGKLKLGEVRKLTEKEYEQIRDRVMKQRERKRSGSSSSEK